MLRLDSLVDYTDGTLEDSPKDSMEWCDHRMNSFESEGMRGNRD